MPRAHRYICSDNNASNQHSPISLPTAPGPHNATRSTLKRSQKDQWCKHAKTKPCPKAVDTVGRLPRKDQFHVFQRDHVQQLDVVAFSQPIQIGSFRDVINFRPHLPQRKPSKIQHVHRLRLRSSSSSSSSHPTAPTAAAGFFLCLFRLIFLALLFVCFL